MADTLILDSSRTDRSSRRADGNVTSANSVPSTLEDLVAPLTEPEFFSLLRDRKLTLVREAGADRFAPLVGWEALKSMIGRGIYPREPDYFRVSKESVVAPPERWSTESETTGIRTIDAAKLEECLAQGFSIVITHLDEHLPALTALCRDIKSRSMERTYAGVIVTSGTDGAFRLHYDFEDLIILQVEGTKRWQIFGPAVCNPLRAMPQPPPPESAPVFDEVLQPGDLLFVPAGNWHHCEAGPGTSVHLGIFLVPPTAWNAVRRLLVQLLPDETFRKPLTRLGSETDLAAHEATVKKRLIEKIHQLKLSDFLPAWSAHMPMQPSPDPDPAAPAMDDSPAPAAGPKLNGKTRSVTPSQFLDNLTLRSLIAPISEEEFRTQYWEQKPMIVHRGDENYYGDLFTLDDFDSAIMRNPSYVKMANAEKTEKNVSYRADKVKGLEGVLADMRDGSTIILDQLHNFEPKLGLLCRSLEPELGHRFQTNLYLTPPNGKGFKPHWDNHDVFILQVLGFKHWHIEKTRRALPAKDETMGQDGRELRGELTSFTLRQGDMVYIPRGFIHAAECGNEPSLHITLGVGAFFLEELLNAAVKAAVKRNENLRSTLPIGFLRGSREDLVKIAMAAFKEVADEDFLGSVVDQYRDELVARFPLDVSGHLREFFRPRPLTLDDIVGPRRGIVYRLQPVEDSVRVLFGSRTITFPGFLRDSLDFALKTSAYAIRDIAGELLDQEKPIFIERLMQEGLVVRK
jgi:ribosomal protein L16 Arg81 hydroxylase